MSLSTLLTVYLTFSLFCGSCAQTCWRNATCTGPLGIAFPGKWQSNIYSLSSRTVSLSLSYSSQLAMSLRSTLTYPHWLAMVQSLSSTLVSRVGGIATIDFISTGPGAIGIAVTEAKNWIGEWSDNLNGKFQGPDGALYANFTS
jgi:hypothetical protein